VFVCLVFLSVCVTVKLDRRMSVSVCIFFCYVSISVCVCYSWEGVCVSELTPKAWERVRVVRECMCVFFTMRLERFVNVSLCMRGCLCVCSTVKLEMYVCARRVWEYLYLLLSDSFALSLSRLRVCVFVPDGLAQALVGSGGRHDLYTKRPYKISLQT
jgi:hypothetical protein